MTPFLLKGGSKYRPHGVVPPVAWARQHPWLYAGGTGLAIVHTPTEPADRMRMRSVEPYQHTLKKPGGLFDQLAVHYCNSG